MTLINKIREKSGLAVAIVAVSLGLFIVGSDLLMNKSSLFGGGDSNPVVGEINGYEVKLREFNEELEQVRRNYEMSQGNPPKEEQMQGLRQSAWQRLVFKYAYIPQFEKLGIKVSPEEINDMVQGNNIHPGIANAFKDEKTGEIDKQRLQDYLANMKKGAFGAQGKMAFDNFVMSLFDDRANTKYEGLLTKTSYATNLEAKREYERQNTKADINFLYVPYTSIPDSAVKPTDEQLKAYYEKNKKDFEKEANVALEYLTFPVKASNEDRLEVAKEASGLIPQLEQTKNDTAFIEANSDTKNYFITGTPKDVPTHINIESATQGKVYGPILDKEVYKLYKIIKIEEDTIFSARASHILFKVDKNAKPEDKAKAKADAEKVLTEIKKGADFAEKARQHGTDGTRNRGGDLGWFDQNTMVKPFSDAVFNATTTGLVQKVVETEFGYHLINITNTKIKNKYTIGVIEKLIQPSDETREKVYRQAGKFARAKNIEEFNKIVEADSGTIKLQALTVSPNARNINNINSPRVREIVRWAYNDDTEIGAVSEIFDLEDQYVIAVLTERTEKGIASFDKVKEDVSRIVIKQLKAEQIIAKLKGTTGSLDERKKAYGDAAIVGTAQDLALKDNSVNRIGFAPKLIGKIFSMQKGETSEPIKEDNGVVIVELSNIDAALETADYSAYKTQLTERNGSTAGFKLTQAINELAEVKEYLYKFF
ncbi:MAG: peptidyl-prolyl cis-trans isomerase [Flammeovirgaceae bacterium]